MQPDGKLVAAGYTPGGNPSDWALIRYNPDGSPDPTFGDGGVVVTSPGNNNEVHALVRQVDGKLIAAGYSERPGTGRDVTLARYDADGSLDPSFGDGGLVVTAVANGHDSANALALQPDGKVVVAGDTSQSGSPQAMVVLRYHTDGSPDLTFAGTGKVITPLHTSLAFSVALQSTGKIVVAGRDFDDSYDMALLRYEPDGTLDLTFGNLGIVIADLSGSSDEASTVLVAEANKLVVAGTSQGKFAVLRYDANGTLDPTFGNGGIVINSPTSGFDVIRAMVRQDDGKLVGAGVRYGAVNWEFALARYIGGACGDGVLAGGEECDDGNLQRCDGCSTTCTVQPPAVCGDGVVDGACGEHCDDGNLADGDACPHTCRLELIPGGGSAKSDCLVEWGVVNPNNVPQLGRDGRLNRVQTCRDNDATCDFDPGVGACTLHLTLCLRVSDPAFPACPSPVLSSFLVLRPKATTAPAVHGDLLTAGTGLLNEGPDVCFGPISFPVPLKASGGVLIAGKQTLSARVRSVTGVRDTDALKLICTP